MVNWQYAGEQGTVPTPQIRDDRWYGTGSASVERGALLVGEAIHSMVDLEHLGLQEEGVVSLCDVLSRTTIPLHTVRRHDREVFGQVVLVGWVPQMMGPGPPAAPVLYLNSAILGTHQVHRLSQSSDKGVCGVA